MKIAPIVVKLRTAETRFGNYIGGSADLRETLENTFRRETAFVVPLFENATPNTQDNAIQQTVNERFGVVVALDNSTSDRDKLGLIPYDQLHEVRAELWKALLGWDMSVEGNQYETLVSYVGGRLVNLTRATLWWVFEFSTDLRIDNDDGVDQEDLPDFKTIYAQYKLEDFGVGD